MTTGIARAEHAGGAVERVDLEAGVVTDRGEAGEFARGESLEAGIDEIFALQRELLAVPPPAR